MPKLLRQPQTKPKGFNGRRKSSKKDRKPKQKLKCLRKKKMLKQLKSLNLISKRNKNNKLSSLNKNKIKRKQMSWRDRDKLSRIN
jgi:hypothetical protein